MPRPTNLLPKPIEVVPKPAQQITYAQAMAAIAIGYEKDPDAAFKVFKNLGTFTQDPSSPLYMPYTSPTNSTHINTLSDLGFGSSIIDDNYFEQASFLKPYFRMSGDGTPLAPTKSSSPYEVAAYSYFKLSQDEPKTKQAEKEWQDLQWEIYYKASRDDMNYSDGEIIDSIDWNKYPTLKSMEEGRTTGRPVTLNRSVDFSYDAIRGTIWSARNGKTTGSRINDAINYELGKGVTYNDNPMLREMRTPSSPNYNPYKSFTMDKEGMLFGTVGFDPDWAQKNKKYLDDDSTRNAYNNVVEAEKFTAQASKDYVDYYDKVMQAVSMGFEPAKAAELYSKSYTQTLGKMDEARLKGDPVKITRAVPYRYEDVLADAEKLYEKVKKQPSTVEFIQSAQESFGQIPTSLETKLRLDEQVKQSVMGLQPAAIANGTPGEISAWRHAYMPGYDGSIEALQAAVQKAKPEELPKVYAVAMQFSNQYANDNWLDDRKSIDDYNALIEAEEAESGRKRDLARQYIDLYLQINTLSTKASKATDWSVAADLQGQADMLAQQQMDIYNQLDAVKASKLVDYANQLWEDSLEISTARDEKKYRDKQSKINAEIDRLFSPVIPEAQTKKYEDANIRLSNMSHSLSAIQELGLEAGAQSIDSVIPALDYLYFYGSEKPGIDRSSYSDVQVWIQAGNSYEEIAPNIAYRSTKINEDINRIDYLIDFLGDDERYKGYYANLRKERENLVREQTELGINRNFFENRDAFEKEANAYKADPNEGDKIARMIIDPYEGVDLYRDDRDRNYVNLMTADEQTIYLALKNRDRAESTALADEYWNILSNETNGRLITRNSEEIRETWKELGKDHPLLMGAVMAPMSAFGQIGAVYYSLSSAIQGKDINPYDPAFATTVASGAVKEGANEAITAYYDGKYGEGSFAGQLINTLYQAATAIAESSTTLLMSGGVAAVSLPVMGLNAAAGAIQDAKARNASNEDALLMGAITFMSEVGTELLPVQGMLKAFQEAGAGGVKTLLRGFASQAGEEWLGESINEIINTVSDDLIMREMSNRKQLEQYYILEEDMSPEAAADRANKDMVNNILQAGLVGALSGGSHTLASAGGYVVQKLNAKHLLDQQRQAANVLKTATIPSITVEQQKVINGMSLLDRALSTEDPASQAISLATVLAAESEDRTAPAAAAELLLSKYGKSGLQTVRNILMDGLDNGIPSESVSYAVAIGALVPDSSAGKALDGIMRGGATPAKVNGLVLAAWQEAQNTQSLNRMSAAIVDNVVAKRMIELAGKQGVDQLDKYDQMEIEAKESVAMAQRAFYAAMTQRDAANEVREQANERYLQALAEGSPEEAQKQLFQDLMTAINDFDAANTLADKKAGDLAQADANAKKLIQNTVKAGKALVEQIRAQAMSDVPDISGAIQEWYAGNNVTIDPVQADKNVRSALDLVASLDKQAEQDPEIKSSPIYRHAMANLKRSMWDVEKSNAFSVIEQHLEIAQSRKQSQVGTTQSDVGTQLANATVLDQAATWQDSQRQPAEDSFAQAGETLNSISDGLAEVQRTLDALKARQSGGLESPETTQEIDRVEAKLAEIQTSLDRSTPTEQLPGAKAEAAEPVGKQAALQTLLDIISPTEQRPGVQPETAESVEKRAKLQTLLDILSPTEQSPGAEPETAGAANKQAALLTLLDTIFPVTQETGEQPAAPDSANKQATIQTLLDTIFPVAQETGAQPAAIDSANKQAAIQTLLDTIAPTEQMPGAEPETAGPANKQAVLQTLLDVIMPTAQRPGTEPEATRSATKQAALQTQLDTAEPVEQVPGQTPETGTADDRRTRLESQGIEAGAVTQTNAERLASLESRLAETARLAETIQVPAQPAADEARTPAQQTAPKTNKIRPADAKKAAGDPANREFISAIKDKTGISIQFSDALPESAEGVYIGSSNTIILNPDTTVLGTVKAVAMHELSHSIEDTSYYAEYADAVLGIEYGKDYANSEQYQRDLDTKIALYKQNGHDLNADMARNEIVAELTRRTVYGTLDDIRAFVSKNPNLAQRILDIIRNIGKQVQRLFGFADDDLTRARTLFENALREHRKVFPGSESAPTGTGITERMDAPGLRKTAPISPVTEGEGVTLSPQELGTEGAGIAGNEGAARAGGEQMKFSERPLAPPLYSKMEKVTADIFKNKHFTHTNWQSLYPYLKKHGVTADEIHWTGLPLLFKVKNPRSILDTDRSVPKDELLEFMRGNAVRVVDVAFPDPNVEIVDRDERAYTEYVLDGGTNYREVLFTVPDLDGTFQSVHWDEKNVLAHARLQDFSTADGKPVLFVEEVQSDWHEKGRERGYETAELTAAIKASDEAHRAFIAAYRHQEKISKNQTSVTEEQLIQALDAVQETRKKYEEADARLREQRYVSPDGAVPPAPFATTWHEYVLKRVLRMAAEGDYDYVAWTTGAMQADRYGLEKTLSRVVSYKLDNSTVRIGAFGRDGGQVSLGTTSFDLASAQAMFGKELGTTIYNGGMNATGYDTYELKGQELKIGGEGMKAFYDIGGKSSQNIPRFLNKYAGQWGAKVDNITIGETGQQYTVPAVEVTDKMRDSVIYEGQPLYSFRDSEYLAAVESGDMDTAQKMVDEAAKAAGYDGPLYHGNRTKTNIFGNTDRKQTGRYENVLHSQGIWMTSDSGNEYGAAAYAGENGQVSHLYYKINNPAKVYDSQVRPWGKEKGINMHDLISQGYDGAVMQETGFIVAFYPEQVKSADPVTYDDAGNPIPLSERFKDSSQDIRYAVRDHDNSLPAASAILSDAELAVKAAQDALRRKSSELLRGGASNSDIAMQLSALATNLQNAEQEYDDLLAQYGPLPQGETPFNPEFEVPRKDTLGQNVTRFTRTVGESGVPTEPQYKSIKQAVVEGKLGYQPLSNKTSMALAAKVLSTGGVQALRSNWEAAIANERIPSKNQIAQGEQLLIEYAKANDGENFLNVMIDLAQAGTRAGQTVQALSMLKRMTAADKLEYANRVLNRVNQDLINKGKTPAEIRPELVDALLKAQGTQAQEEAMDGIIRNIGQQIPPDWKKRVQAWRYLAMLANPKTHIRNVMGNAIFIPAVMLKNQIGAVAEIASGTERTKTFGPVKAEYKNYARELYPTIQKTLASSGKYDSGDALREGMRSFGDSGIGKVLQKLSDFNLNALEAEDRIFLKHHFIQAFGGYLQANNANIGQIDQSMLDKATEHAILEAQKATYRDVSKLADGLSRISKSSPAAGLLIEGIMPFKKTPINILKRGVEYSPLGFLKTLLVDSSKIDPDGGQGKITPAQFIDRLSAGLTGTAIAALGASLNALGLLRLGFKKDDKKDEFGKLTGEQEYSIEIEMFGKRYSMTIDWMIPASMPLFVGATLGEIFTAENGGEPLSMDAIFDAAFNIAEPVFNLTMLQGINRGLQGAGYSENPAASFGIRALTNLASQFAPTLAGQITRTIDPVRRTVYTDKNINIPSELQYTIGSLKNKLFMSTLNDPYINQWGEVEREDNVVMRILENFVFPGYINVVERSKTEDELLRIYEESDNAAMIPKMPSKYFTISGERTDLTSSQYSEVTKTRGRMAKEALDRLLADPTFAFYPTKYQEKMVESIWTYSDITAKRLVREDYTGNWSKTWMDPVANGEIDLVSAVFAEADKGVVEEQKSVYKNQIFDAIDIGGLDGVARADDFIAALESTGMQNSSIKSAITKHYKPLYIEAWKNDSMDVVADIQNTLLMLSGVTYKASDIEGWFLDLEE